MKKENITRGLGKSQKADFGGHAGNKVLPITDATLLSSDNKNDQHSTSENKEKLKSDKVKTVSRMKELLRWAVSAKSEKGRKFIGRKVHHFHKRGTLEAAADDDLLRNESPKISFGFNEDSCSTVTSSCSTTSMAFSLRDDQRENIMSMNSTVTHDGNRGRFRIGHWITTDSEFVVLEL